MNIVAFGASNSKNSINRILANHAAHQIKDAEVILLDLNDFEMPIYSIDREKESGIPQLALDFKQHIKNANGIVISFAEHNGAYSTAFKNIFDWISRIEKNPWDNKPMFLLATSPGARGGKSVLEIANSRFNRVNDNAIFTFSLPSFSDNFSLTKGITNNELERQFRFQLDLFNKALL